MEAEQLQPPSSSPADLGKVGSSLQKVWTVHEGTNAGHEVYPTYRCLTILRCLDTQASCERQLLCCPTGSGAPLWRDQSPRQTAMLGLSGSCKP